MIALLAVLAGGLGAVLRVLTDRAVPVAHLPLGTLAVNLLGSLLLGLLIGGSDSDGVRVVLGAGLLGGYTTFSTFAVQTTRLPAPLAALNVLANVGGCTGAALLGLALAR